MLFHNVGLFSVFFYGTRFRPHYICMQHWHQPKHIIYDITESYIILLNSPYSIFEHLLPQCTAHYQGYRSKTHTHMQSELTDIMRGRVLCWDGMNLLLLQCTDAAAPVLTRFHCRCLHGASHHTLLLTVSALEDCLYTTTEEKLGSYTVVTKRVARLYYQTVYL